MMEIMEEMVGGTLVLVILTGIAAFIAMVYAADGSLEHKDINYSLTSNKESIKYASDSLSKEHREILNDNRALQRSLAEVKAGLDNILDQLSEEQIRREFCCGRLKEKQRDIAADLQKLGGELQRVRTENINLHTENARLRERFFATQWMPSPSRGDDGPEPEL